MADCAISYEVQDDDVTCYKRWHILVNGKQFAYAWFKYALGGWRLWIEGDGKTEWDTRGVIETNDYLEKLITQRFNEILCSTL